MWQTDGFSVTPWRPHIPAAIAPIADERETRKRERERCGFVGGGRDRGPEYLGGCSAGATVRSGCAARR